MQLNLPLGRRRCGVYPRGSQFYRCRYANHRFLEIYEQLTTLEAGNVLRKEHGPAA